MLSLWYHHWGSSIDTPAFPDPSRCRPDLPHSERSVSTKEIRQSQLQNWPQVTQSKCGAGPSAVWRPQLHRPRPPHLEIRSRAQGTTREYPDMNLIMHYWFPCFILVLEGYRVYWRMWHTYRLSKCESHYTVSISISLFCIGVRFRVLHVHMYTSKYAHTKC